MQRCITNYLHEGYMDGLTGKEPNEELTKSSDYEDAWLIGAEDRVKGVPVPAFFGPCENLPLHKGSVVTIPKGTIIKQIGKAPRPAGKTYTVTLHDVYNGTPAYCTGSAFRTDFNRPTSPKVIWPGTGGYWCEADINRIPEAHALKKP
jgi:hypothetical protein